jgi:hypothetical protein
MKAAPGGYTAALALEWSEKVGLLSPEEWQTILSPLPELRLADREYFPDIIKTTTELYQLERLIRAGKWRPSLKVHREQFRRLYRAAFEFNVALAVTRCSPTRMYLTPEERDSYNSQAILSMAESMFLTRLEHIIELSKAAISDPQTLGEIRVEAPFRPAAQSAEAQVLWDCLFRIWWELTGDLKYSENGPLHRFLEAIQVAAGGPPINSESLRKAVQRWRGKRKAPGQ